MTGLPLATDRPADRVRVGARDLAAFAVALSTAFGLIGLALAVVANPFYLDGALDRAGSPAILALPPDEVHAISASVVGELFVGPGTFAQTVSGPGGGPTRFFGSSEAAHLRDVQFLARMLALAVIAAVMVLGIAAARSGGSAWVWRAIGRGAASLAAGLTAAGVFFAVAFEPAFTLFHLVFFPGGNWAFDPREARMVQLYPTPFWEELVLVFAASAAGLALLVWALARGRARRLAAP